MAEHIITGVAGEKIALDFLQKRNYTILEKNWKFKRAEIDIIAKKNNILIFIEVKTRNASLFNEPEIAVNDRKKTLIMDAASQYMEIINHEWEIRFDIISVILHKNDDYEINHFEDAYFY